MDTPVAARLDSIVDGLDPRVRAALQASEPDAQPMVEMSEEAKDMLSAAAAEVGQDIMPRLAGIAPVLGAGVLAKVLRDRRDGAVPRADGASPSEPAGSRIDTRR